MLGCVRIAAKPASNRLVGHDLAVFQSGPMRLVANNSRREAYIDEDNWLAFVVDGLGGHDGPRRSASVIVRSIIEGYSNRDEFCISDAIRNSHADVVAYSREKGFDSCGGAAIAGIWHTSHSTTLFSAGDVAIYLTNSVDRPIGQAVFDAERNSKGRMFNCVGGSYVENVDVKTMEIGFVEGILICSDGFWEPNKDRIEAASCTSDLFSLFESEADDDVSIVSVSFES